MFEVFTRTRKISRFHHPYNVRNIPTFTKRGRLSRIFNKHKINGIFKRRN